MQLFPAGVFNIDNKFSTATNNKTIDRENPATGDFLGRVFAPQIVDANRAVSSSEAAFKSTWPIIVLEKRIGLVNKLADLTEREVRLRSWPHLRQLMQKDVISGIVGS